MGRGWVWRRVLGKGEVVVELSPFAPCLRPRVRAIGAQSSGMVFFWGLRPGGNMISLGWRKNLRLQTLFVGCCCGGLWITFSSFRRKPTRGRGSAGDLAAV